MQANHKKEQILIIEDAYQKKGYIPSDMRKIHTYAYAYCNIFTTLISLTIIEIINYKLFLIFQILQRIANNNVRSSILTVFRNCYCGMHHSSLPGLCWWKCIWYDLPRVLFRVHPYGNFIELLLWKRITIWESFDYQCYLLLQLDGTEWTFQKSHDNFYAINANGYVCESWGINKRQSGIVYGGKIWGGNS